MGRGRWDGLRHGHKQVFSIIIREDKTLSYICRTILWRCNSEPIKKKTDLTMDRSCNAHQKEIRVEKRSPVMPPPPKKAGRQSAIKVPPGFPPLNSSIGKRLAAELSAGGKPSSVLASSVRSLATLVARSRF
ncbi:uncharacterized protein LOC124703163 isoform X2 [Lolium rigidum]|uniref:uncharacterized protein LOC124703163 isoform X2 n=1 Tax=Lolium rigidum TaxID=89674 RepID=UPI001F5CF28B|nr:uncharacterized protein LOC124703163 isoform X2 [Lolium rigidum]